MLDNSLRGHFCGGRDEERERERRAGKRFWDRDLNPNELSSRVARFSNHPPFIVPLLPLHLYQNQWGGGGGLYHDFDVSVCLVYSKCIQDYDIYRYAYTLSLSLDVSLAHVSFPFPIPLPKEKRLIPLEKLNTHVRCRVVLEAACGDVRRPSVRLCMR